MIRMKAIALGVACALTTSGCAMLQSQAEPDGMQIAPVMKVEHGGVRNKALYAVARYLQGQGRQQEAEALYLRILADEPQHAEARNALGVMYAEQGRHEKAIEQFHQALIAAPGAVHIHNNLGYAYLIQGRKSDAIEALELALRMDPGDRRAQENLLQAKALPGAALATKTVEVYPVSQVQPLEEPLSPDAGAKAEASTSSKIQVELRQVAPHMYELRAQPEGPSEPNASQAGALRNDTSPIAARAKTPENASSARSLAPAPAAARLEVSNGNGITGFAKLTSARLQRAGYVITHITNHRAFDQQRTEVQYKPGYERNALQLQALLRRTGLMVESTELRPGIQVRILLGKDASPATILAADEPEAVKWARAESSHEL